MEGSFLSSFKVNGRFRKGMEVSHLLFSSDTLVFSEATQAQMTYLSRLLMLFRAILGLKINLIKSELISTGRVENLEELAFKLGCKVGELQTT